MDIAGLCLPLKPQKERGYIWVFNNRVIETIKISRVN